MQKCLQKACNRLSQFLEPCSAWFEALPPARIPAAIVLASALGLFVELAMIRLHGAYFQVFALLKNVSLLSCFLGFGAGFALASLRSVLFPFFPLLLLSQIAFLRYAVSAFPLLRAGNPILEESMMGMQMQSSGYWFAVAFFVALVFFWNALLFVPVGQLIGKLMQRIPGPRGYGYNLAGSILGVVAFALLSYFWLGGGVWIACAGLCALPFLLSSNKTLFAGIFCLITAIGLTEHSGELAKQLIFSPYQSLEISYPPGKDPVVTANGLYFQKILNLGDAAVETSPELLRTRAYYELPYVLKPQAASALIMGSGTGNDVAAAVRRKIPDITAVEIDPVIAAAGQRLHPEQPYAAPEVNLVVTDARAFVRRDTKIYDLIVYGLLDSHTLISGRAGGGIRLDSYVYTLNAFREARQRLSKDGLLTLSFVAISPEFGHKMYLMLEGAFDAPPRVIQTEYDAGITFIAGSSLSALDLSSSGFEEVTALYRDVKAQVDISTDDWPFLYMTRRAYPVSYLLLWGPLLFACVLLLIPVKAAGPGPFNWGSFFLGAAFMLLETKAFTEIALVCGSTFSVTSLVIVFVLLAAYAANRFVDRFSAPRPQISFGLLLLSLGASYLGTFLPAGILPGTLEIILRGTLLVVPIFFAGMCFSSELVHDGRVGGVFYANLLGAMAGGIIEYFSMLLGFRFLYLGAAMLYASAFAWAMHRKRVVSF